SHKHPRAIYGAQARSLGVLPAGRPAPNPGEFVGTQTLAEIVSEVRDRADVVIIESPPLLHVSDATTLSTLVDAMIVVSRIGLARRDLMSELNRALAICSAPKLGFVLTGADREDGARSYGGYYGGKKSDHYLRSTNSIKSQ